MLIDNIIESLQDEAKEHKAKTILVGLKQTLVILDDSRAGLCMTMRGDYISLPENAYELIQIARSSIPLLSAIGCATINAFLSVNGDELKDKHYTEIMDFRKTDKSAVIGNMYPLVERLKELVDDVVVFEDSPLLMDKTTLPYWSEKILLPDCDSLTATGTSFTNKTVDEILQYSSRARFRSIMGPSTPMSPLMLAPDRFDFIGGTRIVNVHEVMRIISNGGGTRDMGDAVVKTYLNRRRERITGIILSAGAGERMGCINKGLLKIGNKTFLENAVEKLQNAGIYDIIVVLGAQAEDIIETLSIPFVRFILNKDWQDGMLSSIITGLNALSNKTDAVMLHPVDFPSVKLETYKALIELWNKEQHGIISPIYKGKMGHPIIIHRGYFDEIKNASIDKGARVVIHGYEGKKDLILYETDDSGTRGDVDTKEEYEKLGYRM